MVEIADPGAAPAGTRVAEAAAASHRCAVGSPDVRLAIVVPPQQFGFTVAVKVGGCRDVPNGPGVAETGPAGLRGTGNMIPTALLCARVKLNLQ